MSEINQFLGWTPAEGEDTLENFQEFFGSKFIAIDKASSDPSLIAKMEGRRIGSINTTLNRLFGEKLGMNADQLKESKVEDVLNQLNDKWSSEIAEIKSKSKDGKDKQLNDLQALIEDKDKSINSYKESLTKIESEFNSFKESQETEMTNYIINHQLSEEMNKLNFKDGISEIEKQGFKSIIGGQLKFQLDENRKLIVRDANGNPIKSKKSASEHASPAEALSAFAEQNNILKKNNAASKQNQNGSKTVVVGSDNGSQQSHKQLPKSYHQRIAQLTK